MKKFLVVLLIALTGTTCVFAQETSTVSTASDDLFALVDGTEVTALEAVTVEGGYSAFQIRGEYDDGDTVEINIKQSYNPNKKRWYESDIDTTELDRHNEKHKNDKPVPPKTWDYGLSNGVGSPRG